MREDIRQELERISAKLAYDQQHAQNAFDLEIGAEQAILSLVRVLAAFYRDRELMYAVAKVLDACMVTNG